MRLELALSRGNRKSARRNGGSMAHALTGHGPRPGELLLIIESEAGLPAAMVGDLISSLARDYKSMTGRELAVSGVETGSQVYHLMDLLEIAKPYLKEGAAIAGGITAIYKFGKGAIELFSKKKKAAEAANPVEVKNPRNLNRTAIAMLKVAADAGVPLKLECCSPGGEVLRAEITREDALAIRAASELASQRKSLEFEQLAYASPRTATMSVESMADDFEALAQLASPMGNPMVVITVRLLRESGSAHLLRRLISELEARGHRDLAAAVKAEASKGARHP